MDYSDGLNQSLYFFQFQKLVFKKHKQGGFGGVSVGEGKLRFGTVE